MKRILITVSVAALLATTFAVSSNKAQPTFNERWTDNMKLLSEVQPNIPYEKLHAKALEILRGRTVAQDDTPSPMARSLGADDLSRLESCVMFSKATIEKETCK